MPRQVLMLALVVSTAAFVMRPCDRHRGRQLVENVPWEPLRRKQVLLTRPEDALAPADAQVAGGAPSASVQSSASTVWKGDAPEIWLQAKSRPQLSGRERHADVTASPIARVPMQKGYACETPYSDDVRLHIVMPILSRQQYSSLRHLGMIGLTGAHIYAYLREHPNDSNAADIELPCGMQFHERLLLPNHGDEGAAFAMHVAGVYDDLPDAILLLHGGSLHSWHSLCSVAIRRMRAFYRGLGNGPAATAVMKAFAANPVTLNACNQRSWIVGDCCGPVTCRVHGRTDFPECPWERVGDAPIKFEKVHTQALCQLRDRTPETNWTVLSTDVPEFFMRQRDILRSYERDPRMPITHVPGTPITALASHVIGMTDAIKRTWWRRESRSLLSATSESPRRTPLVNYKDVVLPEHNATKLQGVVWADSPVYGLERMYEWTLKVHGLYERYKQELIPGQAPASWCCMSFAAPRHALRRAPKAWWLDVAFLFSHVGWKARDQWPSALGYVLEWGLWPALGYKFTNRIVMDSYLNVERELGEDTLLAQCAATLARPLTNL